MKAIFHELQPYFLLVKGVLIIQKKVHPYDVLNLIACVVVEIISLNNCSQLYSLNLGREQSTEYSTSNESIGPEGGAAWKDPIMINI